jgi:polar amino acid transport system substrate-binding protein
MNGMKNYRFTLAALALLGVIAFPFAVSYTSAAEKARTITVATDATWPPMEFVNAQKQIVGFDIDFLKAVAKEAGFKVKVKNTAWDGIFAGIGW